MVSHPWVCDICGEPYNTAAEAEECQEQGKIDFDIPAGAMFKTKVALTLDELDESSTFQPGSYAIVGRKIDAGMHYPFFSCLIISDDFDRPVGYCSEKLSVMPHILHSWLHTITEKEFKSIRERLTSYSGESFGLDINYFLHEYDVTSIFRGKPEHVHPEYEILEARLAAAEDAEKYEDAGKIAGRLKILRAEACKRAALEISRQEKPQ